MQAQPSSLTRRGLLGAMGAGAVVIGFDAAAGRWVGEDDGVARHVFHGLPPLDGQLLLDGPTRSGYAKDYGLIVSEQPLAVLKPGSAADVSRLLAFAGRHGIRVVGRGRGHTVFGQSQLQAGVVIDLSTLQTIHAIGPDRVEVDAGLRWSALLQATLAQGLMPPALTDFIGQTVGGTLSVGGIGCMTHRHGAQVDNVLALQVVTGAGEWLACSATLRPELFEAALAGQGQVALIVRATLRLQPAPPRIRVATLIYPDGPTLTADAALLAEDGRFEVLEAFAVPQGGGWVHALQVGSYYAPPAVPDPALLDGLRDLRAFASFEDLAFADFANRVPDRAATQVHPWIDLMLPYPAIDGFVAEVQQTLRPLVAGDSFSLLMIPMRTQRFTRPLFRAPDSKLAFGFGILRSLPAGSPVLPQVLAFNRQLFERCRALGGTHYPISALPMAAADWAAHYGPQLGRLQKLKALHDPQRVLAGGPGFL